MASKVNMRESNRTEYAGKEIFEITPIRLGGSPTDLKNKTVLTREQHVQAVNYWNSVINEQREKAKK
jgi:hypothetical protein